MKTQGEMDVETQTATTGGDTGDKTDVQIEAGLFPDALEGAEAVEEMQLHRAPHPLHRPQGTGRLTVRGGEGGAEGVPLEAGKMSPRGDR